MIWHNKLYVLETKGITPVLHWRERVMATLHMIHRAIITSREPVPDIEFSIKIKDQVDLAADGEGEEHGNGNGNGNVTVWSFSRQLGNTAQEQVWLLPDFNFWAYPRTAGAWEDFQRQALELRNCEHKLPELVW